MASSNDPNLILQQEHFAKLVSGVEDYAILLLSPEGNVISWNIGAQRITGYKPEEIVGEHFSIFYTEEARQRRWPGYVLCTAMKEGKFKDEGWRVKKDGSQFWSSVLITAIQSESGSPCGFVEITHDMTARRKADEELLHSEERFRLLVEGVQDYAIFMLDPQGRIVSWNRGAERIKGYSAGEIIGKHFSCFYPPQAIAQGKPDWELQAALKHGRVEDEGWRVTKNGGQFWANVVITALRDKDGNLRGFAKVTRDMTEYRKIEALREADRQKNEFLAVIAHELRNPLASIQNALYVMDQPAATPEEIERVREAAKRQLRQMVRLLDDLLDVARINRGTIELRKERIQVSSAIHHAVEVVRPFIQERQHELTVIVPPDSVWINVDPTRFEQVLTNLLTNAAKYTDVDGRIEVIAEQKASTLLIRVRDSGIGIDPMRLPDIFNIFVKDNHPLNRSTSGLGLGLTVVKKLVELHHGNVEALSAGRGKGSEFVVRLPGVETVEGGLQQDSESALCAVQGFRILVVDDNVDSADSTAMLLKLIGYDVETSYDGPAALELAQTFRPELILLDIGMPGMDGYGVARRFREQAGTEKCILVAMTGWGQKEDQERTKAAGFNAHLVKPVEPALLEKVLRNLKAEGG